MKSLTREVHDTNNSKDVRRITPMLVKVKPLVQEAVNKEVQHRIKTCYPGGHKLKFQSPHTWVPNSAFVNCYSGGQQSVGWHSDQLTYLGPRAVIGSISLGVAREFRVRRILPEMTRITPPRMQTRKDRYQFTSRTTPYW